MSTNHSPEYYRDKVFSLTNIPTLPAVATEILRITREDRFSVRQILPIIEKDPPLALKVMKIANSAYYGLRTEVHSLGRAIVIIGMEELGHLALGFSLLKVFRNEEDARGLHWHRLWEHSAACGHIAQLLVRRFNLKVLGSPHALGLMHDVGKIILYRIDPERFVSAVELARENKLSSSAAELEVFGVTHGNVGTWIAQRWNLPQSILSAIGYHHCPRKVPDPKHRLTTSLIQIADLVCHFKSINFGGDFVRSIPREEEGWGILQKAHENLRHVDFERFVLGIDDEVDAIKEMVRLTEM